VSNYPERTDIGGVNTRDQIINLDAYWREERFEYSGGLKVFVGKHHIRNAPTDDDRWEIWKKNYDGDVVTRIEGPLQGSWDGRNSLTWDDHDAPSGMSDETRLSLDNNDLFKQILNELKIMNLHLQAMTDEEIT
jgi:hypothetical protein